MVILRNILLCVCVCTAITYLDKVRVWGKNIRVAQSRHAIVQMPKEGQPVSTHFMSLFRGRDLLSPFEVNRGLLLFVGLV